MAWLSFLSIKIVKKGKKSQQNKTIIYLPAQFGSCPCHWPFLQTYLLGLPVVPNPQTTVHWELRLTALQLETEWVRPGTDGGQSAQRKIYGMQKRRQKIIQTINFKHVVLKGEF